MVLGMSIQTFTILHVIISLIAIASGLVALLGMLGSHRLPAWTAFFLLTTILTSVTGFMFPIHGFTPALAVGAVSLLVLAVALIAIYARHLTGAWRWIYVVTATVALWFNVFVLIVQSFLKVPFLHALAPNGNEPPFLIAQAATLVIFLVLGIVAAIKFRPAPVAAS
jgi:hypothetical protein